MNRSITGDGVRQTLFEIQKHLPDLEIIETPTGTQVYDWTVPQEWRVRDAYIVRPDGKKICQFKKNNLHLVGYSVPVAATMSLDELTSHLHTLPSQPDATPYVTSYYQGSWGFCLPDAEKISLPDGEYEVVVDSELFDGSLTYGELLIPGSTEKEVLISTYICHPSMANNELSGPCVCTFLAKEVEKIKSRKLSYRFVFLPETIGSITFLSKNLEHLKDRVIAGFNVSCVGDNRSYSFLPSRKGTTLSDNVAKHVLNHTDASYKSYDWSERGSDERQYCAPGIDLPIASIMRTKYGCYSEYHTSKDDLDKVVTAEGLQGGFDVLLKAINLLENNCYPEVTVLGEPQLGKRGLYPTLSNNSNFSAARLTLDVLTWSDGSHSLVDISNKCGAPAWDIYEILKQLEDHDLVTLHENPTK